MIEQGQQAPDFELPDQDGNPVRLSDLRGQRVVLYFYPEADTPGCTTQACGIRDRKDDYDAAAATVLGVSPDPVESVKRFHEKQSLNFNLLADEDHSVCEAYGVWSGRAERTTFVIDEDGAIARVLPNVKPKQHDELVLAAL